MKVLVTSKSFGRFDSEAVRHLEDNGFTVIRKTAAELGRDGIAGAIRGMDVLIVGNDVVDAAVFAAADRLKLIHMNGTGLDGIDMAAATRHGVLVANAPGANRNAVAELTIALMLVAGRRIDRHMALLRSGRWERTPGREISGSTVGILGLGNIGRRVVELLAGFAPRIVAFDPAADAPWAAAHGVEMLPAADEVLGAADFLVLTLPLNDRTRHLIDDRALGLMKPSAVIVNTSRGGLIDDEALARAIRGGRIRCAALDAFATEPLPVDSPLRDLDIVITPHLAATSEQSTARVSAQVAHNVVDILKHGRIGLAVNAAEVGGTPAASVSFHF